MPVIDLKLLAEIRKREPKLAFLVNNADAAWGSGTGWGCTYFRSESGY